MSNETQIAEMSEPVKAALESRGIEDAVWQAISSSVFPGATDESKLMAWDYCKARQLDILKKPCHIVPMNVKDNKTGKYGWRDVIMPGIAECRITASRTGAYAGQDEPVFGETVELQIGKSKHRVPEFCSIKVYRVLNGERVGFYHTEFFEEAYGKTKEGDLNSMWTKRKRGQLAKCAEAGALRKAFPEELGGLITSDEAITDMINVTPSKEQKSYLRAAPIDPTKPIQKSIEPPEEEPKPESDDGMVHAVVSEVSKVNAKKDDKTVTAYVAMLFVDGKELRCGTYEESIGKKVEGLKCAEVLVKLKETGTGHEILEIKDAMEGDL